MRPSIHKSMPCHAAKYSPAFLFFLSCCCFSFSRGFLGVTEVFVLCRLRLFCLCLRASATPCMRIRQAPPEPTPPHPFAPFSSLLQACWVDIQARLVNAHPAKHPPHTPCTFLLFSYRFVCPFFSLRLVRWTSRLV